MLAHWLIAIALVSQVDAQTAAQPAAEPAKSADAAQQTASSIGDSARMLPARVSNERTLLSKPKRLAISRTRTLTAAGAPRGRSLVGRARRPGGVCAGPCADDGCAGPS